jgi:hypothetical protein
LIFVIFRAALVIFHFHVFHAFSRSFGVFARPIARFFTLSFFWSLGDHYKWYKFYRKQNMCEINRPIVASLSQSSPWVQVRHPIWK